MYKIQQPKKLTMNIAVTIFLLFSHTRSISFTLYCRHKGNLFLLNDLLTYLPYGQQTPRVFLTRDRIHIQM